MPKNRNQNIKTKHAFNFGQLQYPIHPISKLINYINQDTYDEGIQKIENDIASKSKPPCQENILHDLHLL